VSDILTERIEDIALVWEATQILQALTDASKKDGLNINAERTKYTRGYQ
jgi:hypothetical protein